MKTALFTGTFDPFTIGHIETLLLYAEPGMDSISSSAVRELEHFGYPTDSFIPHKQ